MLDRKGGCRRNTDEVVEGDIGANPASVLYDQGRIDVAFANTGNPGQAALGNIDEARFDRLFDINVKGMVFTVRKALPLMSAGGSVAPTRSGAGMRGFPDLCICSATKAAMATCLRNNDGAEAWIQQTIPFGRLRQTEKIAKATLSLALGDSNLLDAKNCWSTAASGRLMGGSYARSS
ncbi:SDR family oxidoreductase [Plastorhodobacter daqingensis]|uniref:SDR family oxidoreductase n=1 Tax=Plastorhodobacter daqingensis TaxID=1387281 RepID=A0ABW2UR13_9RHOB